MARTNEWLGRIETYLELGSSGVLIMLAHAGREHLGPLVRRLLGRYADVSVATRASELAKLRRGSVVVLAPDHLEYPALNMVRPVLKDRSLRVVLSVSKSNQGDLAREAPDFYDWISHRVEAPAGEVPGFVVRGLLAAEQARRPIVWSGSERMLVRGIVRAWPNLKVRHVDALGRSYEGLLRELRGRDESFVLISSPESRVRELRWALAETQRYTRVALLQQVRRSRTSHPGFWHLSGSQSDPRSGLDACILDLERAPTVELSRASEEVLSRWRVESLDHQDPGALLAALVGPSAWLDIGIGSAEAHQLRAFGADAQASEAVAVELLEAPANAIWSASAVFEREQLSSAPKLYEAPLSVQIEAELWRPTPAWLRIAEQASALDGFEAALHWGRKGGRLQADTVEAALVARSLADAESLLDEIKLDAQEQELPWLSGLGMRVACDASDLTSVRKALPNVPWQAHRAYAQAVLGDWHGARSSLALLPPFETLGPLSRESAIFAAWACSEPANLPNAIGSVDPPTRRAWREDFVTWARWLLVFEPAVPKHAWHQRLVDDGSMSSLCSLSSYPARGSLALALAAWASGQDVEATQHAADGLRLLEFEFAPREHWLEGLLELVQGRALGRLAKPERAMDRFRRAAAILRRTTSNQEHPFALLADFEASWSRAARGVAEIEEVDAALARLAEALWPEHSELARARDRRARL